MLGLRLLPVFSVMMVLRRYSCIGASIALNSSLLPTTDIPLSSTLRVNDTIQSTNPQDVKISTISTVFDVTSPETTTYSDEANRSVFYAAVIVFSLLFGLAGIYVLYRVGKWAGQMYCEGQSPSPDQDDDDSDDDDDDSSTPLVGAGGSEHNQTPPRSSGTQDEGVNPQDEDEDEDNEDSTLLKTSESGDSKDVNK